MLLITLLLLVVSPKKQLRSSKTRYQHFYCRFFVPFNLQLTGQEFATLTRDEFVEQLKSADFGTKQITRNSWPTIYNKYVTFLHQIINNEIHVFYRRKFCFNWIWNVHILFFNKQQFNNFFLRIVSFFISIMLGFQKPNDSIIRKSNMRLRFTTLFSAQLILLCGPWQNKNATIKSAFLGFTGIHMASEKLD